MGENFLQGILESTDVVAVASSCILFILSSLFAYAIFALQKKRYELSYEENSYINLIKSSNLIADKLQILYNGREITNLSMYTVEITNTGNQSVKLPGNDSQYERPLKLIFSDNIQIFEVRVLSELKLNANVEWLDKEIIFSPVLLNPKDKFSLQILVSGELNKSPYFDFRIENISELKRLIKEESSQGCMYTLVFILTLPLFVLTLLRLILGQVPYELLLGNLLALIFTAMCITLLRSEATKTLKKFFRL